MNYPLVARLLGNIAWLIGGAMLFSIPWAWPALGGGEAFETRGVFALLGSVVVCAGVGGVLRHLGRGSRLNLYRKEAMAVVGLGWVMATLLGAVPFLLAGVSRGWQEAPSATAAGVPLDLPLYERIVDWLFESQSGFSTTGATVIRDLESPVLIPRCILFWRSTTHFLGGLGIIVLFVAVLGHGAAGKALMRAEITGPTKQGQQERMQHTAWAFAGIYCGLNGLLAVILRLEGMPTFDALCHAFGTLGTGGFSTKNASLGWFGENGYNGPLIEYTVTVFMVLAGTNFSLLYLLLVRRPERLWADVEWRTYIFIILGVTAALIGVAMAWYHDFDPNHELSKWQEFQQALRYGLFQVVSILTTTGFGTHDFNQWNSFARAMLFLLMFVGGCAGSTGGGLKVIRHVLFIKILRLEIEQSFHPTVVRQVRLGGEPVTDPDLRRNILVYFGLVSAIFVVSWIVLVLVEPDQTWLASGKRLDEKLIDSASAIAATLNNIGPGLGIVGATENYAAFSWPSKLLFTLLMMLGRLELFAILVLFVPSFWRNR
jgi:trk system potassium uptake protein TrkH